MYEYEVKIVNVVDGDTLDLMVDLGFNVHTKVRVRLARVNSPELKTPEGKLAKEVVTSLITSTDVLFGKVLFKSVGKDRYGRYIAELTLPKHGNLSDYLLSGKHALPYLS